MAQHGSQHFEKMTPRHSYAEQVWICVANARALFLKAFKLNLVQDGLTWLVFFYFKVAPQAFL